MAQLPRAAALALSLLAAACAEPAGPASVELLARLPERVGPFGRNGPAQRDTAPSTVEGAFQRYLAPFGIATVFLYREAGPPVPPGPDSPAVQRQLLAATEQLIFVAVAGATGQPAVSHRARPGFGVRAARGPAWRCSETWRGSAGAHQEVAEYACLTGAEGRFLKLRVSLRGVGTAEASARQMVGDFASLVGAVVTSAPDPSGAPRPSPAPAPVEDDAVPDE